MPTVHRQFWLLKAISLWTASHLSQWIRCAKPSKHFYEEADHQMVSHSIDFTQNDPETILDVYSLDTGVLFLLMAFHPEISTATTLLRLNNEKLSILTLVGLFQKL